MKTIAILFVSFASSFALAHTAMVPTSDLKPRSPRSNLKKGPCGGIARTTTPAIHKPGETIKIDWKETINHPGHFEILFSEKDDKDFQLLKSIPDNQDNANDLPHVYSTKVKLPNVTCDACTVQLIQVMEEIPENPENYYSCADIVLKN